MHFFAVILLAVLTRAEIIDRMRAAPMTRVNGLVQVIGFCPPDMRDEYQASVSEFVSELCRKLYHLRHERERRFKTPGIVVCLGDVRTNCTDVVSRVRQYSDGTPYTRITLPAPGFADMETFRRETIKAFYLAVANETLDDAGADKCFRAAHPELLLADKYADLANWERGAPTEKADDEYYLQMTRKILKPGVAYPSDVLRFAARLYFYPESFAFPFCGKYFACSYRDAIDLVPQEIRLRLLAFAQIQDVIMYGGGRGETLATASLAYADFLRELAAYKKTPEELHKMLDAADEKLKLAFEEARQRAEGTLQ